MGIGRRLQKKEKGVFLQQPCLILNRNKMCQAIQNGQTHFICGDYSRQTATIRPVNIQGH